MNGWELVGWSAAVGAVVVIAAVVVLVVVSVAREVWHPKSQGQGVFRGRDQR